MSEPVIVVSGLPRSGTSVMMQMLEAAGVGILTDHHRRADADNPRGYYELEAVKRTKQDAGWRDGAAGRAVKLVHLLLFDLPTDRRYRVIVMRRNMDEVLASQQKMLARSGKPGGNLPAEAMKRVLADQLDQAMAHLEAEPAFAFIKVSYNDLMADPAAQAKRVAAFLQLDPVAADRMAAAVDAALYRNRA